MTDEATAPRRLRAQDVIDAQQRTIEQLTTRSGEPYVTVEHTLNAKGDTQTSVKVSAPMGHSLLDLQDYAEGVERVAHRIYGLAIERHPRTNGETTEPKAKDADKTARAAAAIARAKS